MECDACDATIGANPQCDACEDWGRTKQGTFKTRVLGNVVGAGIRSFGGMHEEIRSLRKTYGVGLRAAAACLQMSATDLSSVENGSAVFWDWDYVLDEAERRYAIHAQACVCGHIRESHMHGMHDKPLIMACHRCDCNQYVTEQPNVLEAMPWLET